MKGYKYDGITYTSESILRKAVWVKSRAALPKLSTAEEWAKFGVEVVEVESQPTEEQLAQQARAKRDRLLSYCDFYLMPDYPATEEGLAEVKVYRQALRDITKQEGFPKEIVWPEVPEVLQ